MPASRAKRKRTRSGGSKSTTKSVRRAPGVRRARPPRAARATALAIDLQAERRAERLQADARQAILETRTALRQQFRAALAGNQADSAKKINDNIGTLTAQLDELSQTSLDALEESDDVRQTIEKLSVSAKALADEAAKITDIASAISKGAQAVQKATEIVGAIKGLVPIG